MNHFVVLLAFLVLFSFNQNETKTQVETKSETFKVGVAYRSITPKMGAFIAGDKNNRQFTAVHDSLYVKAIVLSDAKNMMALLVYDNIGMLHPTLLDVRERISKRIPSEEFDPSHIVMASTHTHSGPDVVGIWGPDQGTSGVDPEYMEEIIQKSSDVLFEAWENREEATAVYAESEFGEDWVFNISDSLNLDRSLTTLQFLDSQGESMATLNNFACHPTIMDAVSTEVSADFVGSMYAVLDESLGGVNIFLQGAIGGWVQPEYEAKTFESVQKRGTELGNSILAALEDPTELSSAPLAFKSKKINLPVSNDNFKQLSQYGIINRAITDSVGTEIAWFSIGNAQFVTHPGETTPTHSKLSKKLMTNQGPKFVVGLGMDALGYILTPDFYEEDPKVKHAGYLTYMSIDSLAGPIIMENISELSGRQIVPGK